MNKYTGMCPHCGCDVLIRDVQVVGINNQIHDCLFRTQDAPPTDLYRFVCNRCTKYSFGIATYSNSVLGIHEDECKAGKGGGLSDE